MVRYKARTGATQLSGDKVKVFTIPKDIAVFTEGVSYSVQMSGTTIMYESGTKQVITEKQVEEYKFEDCRI